MNTTRKPHTRSTKQQSSTAGNSGQDKKLFIVESPTKVRTIEKYLGSDYIVAATVGHIADIPTRTGMVNVEKDFAATYELTDKGRSVIADLKKLMSTCSEVILATDADREGELIAAHLFEYLNPTVPVKRVAFHAVTKAGIEEALQNPRDIDWNLVEAARARRILDRLFGFEVSDVSRRKVRRDTTAGRVQSPALRLVVEREYERLRFVSATYADVVAHSATEPTFGSTLKKVNGQTIATGKDFDALGVLTSTSHRLGIEDAQVIAAELEQGSATLVVADVTEKSMTRQPQPPCHTRCDCGTFRK
jgi:DNA topoisomerase-1